MQDSSATGSQRQAGQDGETFKLQWDKSHQSQQGPEERRHTRRWRGTSGTAGAGRPGNAWHALEPTPRVPRRPARAPATGMSGKGPGTVWVPHFWTPTNNCITEATDFRAGIA